MESFCRFISLVGQQSQQPVHQKTYTLPTYIGHCRWDSIIDHFIIPSIMTVLSKPTILYGIGVAVVWWLNGVIQQRRSNPNNLPLPPGPKGYPIIGSFLDFPTYKPWLTYDKWFKIYGVF